MRADILIETAKNYRLWLEDWSPAYHALSRAYAQLRRAVQRAGKNGTEGEASHEVVDLLLEYDPERFVSSVLSHLPTTRFDDHDIERITQFIRLSPPQDDSSPREALEWLSEYRAAVGIAIEHFEQARSDVFYELELIQAAPRIEDRQPTPGTQPQSADTESALPMDRSLARPNPGIGDEHADGLPGPDDYLGLKVYPTTCTVRRLGFPNEIKLSKHGSRLRSNVLKCLISAKHHGYPVSDFMNRWGELGGCDDPSQGAVEDLLSRLRGKIKPLRVSLNNRNERYYLEDEATE